MGIVAKKYKVLLLSVTVAAGCFKTDYIFFFLGKQFVTETQHFLTLGRCVYYYYYLLVITWYLPACTPLQGFEDFGNSAVH